MVTLLTITTVQWYGIVLIIAGVVCRYIVGRNRFNRRGIGGLQQFSNYNKALATSFAERLLKLAGPILIVGGLFLYAVEWFNKKEC